MEKSYGCDIVSASGEDLEKFIRELHGLTTHVKIRVISISLSHSYRKQIQLCIYKVK